MPHNKISKCLVIMPNHCAEVAVISAGKKFSSKKIVEGLVGKPVFYLTKYVILREGEGKLKNGERASILRVWTDGNNLLRTVVGGEVLAHPGRCTTLNDSTLDEFNLNQIVLRAAVARSNGRVEAVILSGRNANITFVFFRNEDLVLPLKLLLVDITPPIPSRLETLIRTARASELVSEHIDIEILNVDAHEITMEAARGGSHILTPCLPENWNEHQSMINFKKLIDSIEKCRNLSIALIGCSLSQEVLLEFQKYTGLNINFTVKDICPMHAARDVVMSADVHGLIVRCCKRMEGILPITLNNTPVMVLPWTPSLADLLKAVDNIVRLVTGLMVN